MELFIHLIRNVDEFTEFVWDGIKASGGKRANKTHLWPVYQLIISKPISHHLAAVRALIETCDRPNRLLLLWSLHFLPPAGQWTRTSAGRVSGDSREDAAHKHGARGQNHVCQESVITNSESFLRSRWLSVCRWGPTAVMRWWLWISWGRFQALPSDPRYPPSLLCFHLLAVM